MEVNLHKSMALDLYDGLSKLKDNEIPVHARSQLWSCARNDPRLGLARSSSCLPGQLPLEQKRKKKSYEEWLQLVRNKEPTGTKNERKAEQEGEPAGEDGVDGSCPQPLPLSLWTRHVHNGRR